MTFPEVTLYDEVSNLRASDDKNHQGLSLCRGERWAARCQWAAGALPCLSRTRRKASGRILKAKCSSGGKLGLFPVYRVVTDATRRFQIALWSLKFLCSKSSTLSNHMHYDGLRKAYPGFGKESQIERGCTSVSIAPKRKQPLERMKLVPGCQ